MTAQLDDNQSTTSGIEIGNDRAFVLIAGPCQIESRTHALDMAHAQHPDLVMITPLVGVVASSQLDLLRSAKAHRVPVAVCVWSWDHLSSKAIIRDLPDRLLVWNDVQKREATEMHAVPPDRVIVIGSRRCDRANSDRVAATRTSRAAGAERG